MICRLVASLAVDVVAGGAVGPVRSAPARTVSAPVGAAVTEARLLTSPLESTLYHI
jgi:hypothetical protein